MPGRLGRALLLSAVVAAGGTARAEENPDLERAKAQIESMQLDQARGSLERALERGDNDLDAVIEILRLKGEVAVGMGGAGAAREAFEQLLVLRPDYELDEMVSPKIRSEFEAAREALGGRSLELSHEVVEGDNPSVALVIGADPKGMVAGAELSHERAPAPVSVRRTGGTSRVMVPVPAGAKGVELRALDEHRNVLRVFEVGDLEPSSAAPPPHDPIERSGRRPGIHQRWWLWAGVVGAFAATGAGFGIAAARAEDDLSDALADSEDHFYSEVQAIRDRGKRYALIANVSFGAAVIAAGVGGYFVWQGMGAGEERSVKVSPAAGPEGASVSLEVSF